MKTTSYNDNPKMEMHQILEESETNLEQSPINYTTKILSQRYSKLNSLPEKVNFLGEYITGKNDSKRTALELANLSHYWANRVQLSARASIIDRQNDYTEYASMQQTEFASASEPLTIPTISNTILDTMKNSAKQQVTLDMVLDNLEKICVELIFTEHPTDPLSEHANQALRNINRDTTPENRKKNILELATRPLTPSKKRSVIEEIDRDLTMLKMVFNAYPEFIERVKQAINLYYPKASVLQLDRLNKIITASSNNRFLQGGGWAGFDADGNDEVRPDRSLYALIKRRVSALDLYIEYVEENILPTLNPDQNQQIITKYEQLVTKFKSSRDDLNKQMRNLELIVEGPIGNWLEHYIKVNNIEKNCQKHYIDADYLLNTHQGIINEDKALLENESYKKVNNVFIGLINNFGMGVGRADIRQKSYTNLRVITTILEDLKQDPQLANMDILSAIKSPKTFIDLSDEEKILLLETLANGSKESNLLLAIIKNKFITGYYLNIDKDEYKYLADNPLFPKDTKIILTHEAHCELLRNHISCNNDQIIQKSIISNTEHCSDLFIQDFLRNIFNSNTRIMTMPLIESMKDLENSEKIMNRYILHKIEIFLKKTIEQEIKQTATESKQGRSKLQELLKISTIEEVKNVLNKGPKYFAELRKDNPELDSYLKQVHIATMVGFSDSERESGTSALHSVDKAINLQRQLAENYGINYSYFGGAGGDIERGGESRNCQEQTFQGNVKRNFASTQEDLLLKLEQQFSAGYKENTEIEHLSSEIVELIEQYKNITSKSYELLYDTDKGYEKLTAVLYGIGAHNTIIDASNFSSRATVLGNKSTVPFILLNKLRAITKVQDDEVARHYLGLNVGPDQAFKQLKIDQLVKLYTHSATQRDIMVKTAIGIALTDWSIEWLNFPKELRPYKNNGELDQDKLTSMAMRAQKNLPLLKELDIETIMKNPDSQNEKYKQVMEMVADLNALLHFNNLELSKQLFTMFKKVYPGSNPAKELIHPTDILFFAPKLQQYYKELLAEIEPLSILTNMINMQTQIYSSKISDLFVNHAPVIVGNIAAAFEAFRVDPPYHFDPMYFDHQKSIITPGERRMMNDEQPPKKSWVSEVKKDLEEPLGKFYQKHVERSRKPGVSIEVY